jgi:hypothetical protein
MTQVVYGARDIDMSEVGALAKLPVKEIIQNAPVSELEHRTYWETVMGSKVPVVVMFYSNEDKHSQNLATLLRYVASDYSGKLLFCSFMVVNEGKPNKETIGKLERLYSLDKVPGVLFYDHDTGRMELEHEHYEIPELKEYRTPSMWLWKTYYKSVEEIIEKKILD